MQHKPCKTPSYRNQVKSEGNDQVPSNALVEPIDAGNNATSRAYNQDYTIGSPYYRTEIGAHENSKSPYGTSDQSGNVWEWNEALLPVASRGLRGGAFDTGNDENLGARIRSYHFFPTFELYPFGFRVAEVP